MEEIEREAILQTLERTSGNVRRSAQILRFPRPTFYRKLKKLGIKVERNGDRSMRKACPSAWVIPRTDPSQISAGGLSQWSKYASSWSTPRSDCFTLRHFHISHSETLWNKNGPALRAWLLQSALTIPIEPLALDVGSLFKQAILNGGAD